MYQDSNYSYTEKYDFREMTIGEIMEVVYNTKKKIESELADKKILV